MPWWRGRPAHPDLGETIRSARLAAGLSLSQLALRVGCDPRYIEYLQRGDRCPSAVMAGRLQAVLGVPIPMPAIKPSELSKSSLNRIRRAQRKAQQERDAAFLAANPPKPAYEGPRFVSGW